MTDFGEWLAGETAGERRRLNGAAAAAETRRQRADVWHNYLHTGETVRTIRTAERTAGKVARERTDGNGLRSGRTVSTAGQYSQRIRKSAERQYFDRIDAAERRRMIEAAARAW